MSNMPVPVGQMRFVPKPDQQIIVELPGERTRATVVEMVDEDTLVAELTSVVMGKSHVYRTGNVVPVQRIKDNFGQYAWEVIDERELSMRERAARVARDVAEENQDAAGIGIEPERDQPEHQGIEDVGTEPAPERRDSPVKRKKASAK